MGGKRKLLAVIDELTQVQDLLPTLIDLCALDTATKPTDFNGTSLATLLKGFASELPDRKLVIQYRTSGAPWDPVGVLWKKWRLVNGKELYHIGEDPGQEHDVAAKHPDIVKTMSDHYDSWHAEAKPLFDRERWITLGTEQEPSSILYAQDWAGDYCDNRGGLTQARAKGYWNVIVDRPGIYELELRRWPKESDKTLTEGFNGRNDTGISARPITAVNVQIAGANHTLDAKPGATHVTFRIKLPAGRTQLATHLLDSEDRTLCSAMYTYVKRLPGSDPTLTPQSDRKPKPAKPAPPRKPRKEKNATGSSAPISLSPTDILLADFEGETYGDWKSTGTAFGSGPTGSKGRVSGHQGKSLVDSFLLNESDKPTGTLTSPPFPINRRYLNFLIGGGQTPGKTCVNLLVDDKPARSAVGSATKNEEGKKVMHWVSWDLGKLQDKPARIQIVDQSSGGWGHIMADQFFLSNKPAAK